MKSKNAVVLLIGACLGFAINAIAQEPATTPDRRNAIPSGNFIDYGSDVWTMEEEIAFWERAYYEAFVKTHGEEMWPHRAFIDQGTTIRMWFFLKMAAEARRRYGLSFNRGPIKPESR